MEQGVIICFHLCLANALLVYHEEKCLENCPLDFKPFWYRMYVDNLFVLLN